MAKIAVAFSPRWNALVWWMITINSARIVYEI